MGGMTNEYMHCKVLTFLGENFKCCHNGKVSLTELCCYPEELKCLLVGTTDRDKHFQTNIRYYNSFASMGAALSQPPESGPLCFRICGQIFHHYGPLHSIPGESPHYSQLYIDFIFVYCYCMYKEPNRMRTFVQLMVMLLRPSRWRVIYWDF